jgi:2-oxoglutarate dehydrogenase E1 component
VQKLIRANGRPASAATAAGTMSKHQAQLRAFLDEAFSARVSSMAAE